MALLDRVRLRARQTGGAYLHEFVARTFFFFERWGLHLTLNHYYSPVPDTRKLTDGLFATRSAMPGVDFSEERQLTLLKEFVARYKAEYDALPVHPTGTVHAFYLDNPAVPPVDAEILYCMIRHHRPRRIVEIGSGHSTRLAAHAAFVNAAKHGGAPCEVVAIEPYPDDVLRRGFPGLSRLIARELQDVPLAEFETLGDGDILFIDSSHVLRMGNDVQYEYLEILPRLKPGVIVHVHDIHMPFHYPKALVIGSRRFWNEQYVLQAFLACNDSFEVLWGSHFMLTCHRDALAAAFPTSIGLPRLWPSSCWIRRTR
jgi:hypothetical protein